MVGGRDRITLLNWEKVVTIMPHEMLHNLETVRNVPIDVYGKLFRQREQ